MRAAARIFSIVFAVAAPSYLITYSGFIIPWQNVLDIVAFAFAVTNPVLNRQRIVYALTTPQFKTAHLHTIGWLLVCVGVCLSAISAIHWRASGHLASLNDGGVRVTFRILYAEGLACLLMAAGDYEPDLSWRRLRGIGVWLAAIAFMIAVFFYGDRLRDIMWPKPEGAEPIVIERPQ
jgi:uncharacterized membrane protein YidH (DUF202 family)